ncbi:Ferrichrome receptor FcuA precursor [Achromobacter spanius]|uniref:TonB-dependent receptor n=1 Tax=Achromobacter spanius TaxID=217203 RepID=UPI000C2B995C|nr:TonB-dependent receptor [Achromobacter spanius]AUA57758.1 TonB-dependent siderophore receptor [Achromobacter spanius]CAB3626935.1 Ferrichrome receptor FcuA [Achromobacter spanius]SPT38026.1 Ferrichrome receptor FcuA precursor [Achromobacter denitrificans]VEE60209.1 Ferrichrome receptor FcuA precursor [Achromobacter spanius]
MSPRFSPAPTLALALALSAIWAPALHAQPAAAGAGQASELLTFDIPAAPVGQVLTRLANETGILLAAPPQLLAGRQSSGVRGRYSRADALSQALAGTGLRATREAPNQFRLSAIPDAGTATLAPVTVTGSALGSGLPPAYAGGQVATGGRVGLLGNMSDMDTPFSATQYTAKLIEDQQAQNIGDVLVNDPSVRNTYSRGAGRDEFNIRGFTLFNYDVSFNGLYGVSPRNASSLIGVERVEVLRGPNALLNGMAPYGSVGGAINLVPKRAGVEPLNRYTVNYIGDSQFGVHADLARRYGDSQEWGVRLNVAGSGGDLPQDGAKESLGAVALGLDYQGERFRVEGDINYQNRNTDARSGLLFAPAPGVDIGSAPDARRNFFPSWTYWKTKEWSGALRAEYDLTPDWTVYGAIGARKHDFESLQTSWLMLDTNGDIGAVPARLNESLLSKTGEVGLRGRFNTGPVKHEPSISASALDIDYSSARIRSSTIFSNLYDPADLPKPNIARPGDLPRTSESRLYSVALADKLSFADDRVQIIAGFRHQRIESTNFDAATGRTSSEYKKSAVTPAFALTVRPTQRLSLYGNYIEGLSQGATAPEGAVNAGEMFAPEIAKQIEVGGKYDFGDFSTTLSAFQIEKPSSYLDPASLRYVSNGQQRNRGLEWLVQGDAAPGVRLLGGVAYTDARLTRTEGGANDGNHAPAVPRFQFNAAAEWDTPFLHGLTLTARMLRTTQQYVDVGNTQTIPGWTRFDLGARYAFNANGTPMVVRATVENVFNKNYWQSAAREGLTVGAPRTVLLSVSAEF